MLFKKILSFAVIGNTNGYDFSKITVQYLGFFKTEEIVFKPEKEIWRWYYLSTGKPAMQRNPKKFGKEFIAKSKLNLIQSFFCAEFCHIEGFKK